MCGIDNRKLITTCYGPPIRPKKARGLNTGRVKNKVKVDGFHISYQLD